MVQRIAAGAAVPRGMLIADAWAQLGDTVAPLSNTSGRPLARTVKLLLDPLVLRPTLNPRFAGGLIGLAHVDDLRRTLLDAGPALAATAAWFQLLKKARRRAGITEGNPQDLYFQRCYELAHEHGAPHALPDADAIAAATVTDIRAERGDVTVDRLRRFMTDPDQVVKLAGILQNAWDDRPEPPHAPPDGLTAFLDTCPTRPDAHLWKTLVDRAVGTAEAAELDRPRVARDYGLTAREQPQPPELGDRASKRRLPPPFDRSIMERLFAAFTAVFHRESMGDIPSMVVGEIHRSAAPWQLADEPSRVAMALGRDASDGIDYWVDTTPTSDANAHLMARYSREEYVHAVHRQPDPESAKVPEALKREIMNVQEPYLRRLWARLHGRELRGETTTADTMWDLLDGVFRSVLLDQRDRLRRLLEREGDRA
ncbi:hypothetical protein [Glycomyces sp. NPDC048151]|uniref:hypothetical protein n=1 Tax=Glycomyces sp. NPDC048151 TaxID=3364002 RepID=UPI0037205EA6